MSNKYFNQLIDSILSLIAIDSVQSEPCERSPFGEGVGKCLEQVEKICTNFGFKTHNECGYYLTSTIGDGKEFGILGHVDVVPYDIKEWNFSPLGEIKDDILYGRGVLDDKGPMLCCLFAVKELLDEGFKLKRKIKFIFGGNEESGWKCIERYNKVDKMPSEGISPDAEFPVINCEKGIAEITLLIDKPASLIDIRGGVRSNVVIGECTALVNKVLPPIKSNSLIVSSKDGVSTLYGIGKPAHGSTPEKGDNALFHILSYLKDESEEYNRLYKLLCHIDGSGANIKLSDKQSGALTFNVGIIECIKDKLKITLDIRFPISYDKEDILNRINSAFKTTGKITHYHDPLFVSKDSPLVKTLISSYEEVTNTKVEPLTIGGGTYARALKNGVAFGPIFPGEESTVHQANERISLSSLFLAYEVYKKALLNICFEK